MSALGAYGGGGGDEPEHGCSGQACIRPWIRRRPWCRRLYPRGRLQR